MGRLRLSLSASAQQSGDLRLPEDPHFLWVTEFPLFTKADSDKDFLAHGRWSSSHHPFTAPMWEDINKMYDGRIEEVCHGRTMSDLPPSLTHPVRTTQTQYFRYAGTRATLRPRVERRGDWRRVRAGTRRCHADVHIHRSASGKQPSLILVLLLFCPLNSSLHPCIHQPSTLDLTVDRERDVLLQPPSACTALWCPASWRHSIRYVRWSLHPCSSALVDIPIAHRVRLLLPSFTIRFRPPHGYTMQDRIHPRRDCVPEDERRHGPTLQ